MQQGIKTSPRLRRHGLTTSLTGMSSHSMRSPPPSLNLPVLGAGTCSGDWWEKEELKKEREENETPTERDWVGWICFAYVDASRAKTRLVWAEGAFVFGFGSWELLISRFQISGLSFRL